MCNIFVVYAYQYLEWQEELFKEYLKFIEVSTNSKKPIDDKKCIQCIQREKIFFCLINDTYSNLCGM